MVIKGYKMKTIKILGYTYTISTTSKKKVEGFSGRADCSRHILYISPLICEEEKISTLLHEIIETLKVHLDLQISHHKITLLENGIYTILKDNGIDISKLLRNKKRAKNRKRLHNNRKIHNI